MRCPACHVDVARRVGGSCPHCHTPVELYDGRLVRTGEGSPNQAIVRAFEQHVSAQLSIGRAQAVVFRFPRKTGALRRELAVAELLLQLADDDLDLVREAFAVLFSHKTFAWKRRTTLRGIDSDFTAALVLARANRADQEEQRRKQEATVARLARRENIFD